MKLMEIAERTWTEISLKALEHNYNELRALIPGDCLLLATLKADAYGHGAERAALRLQVLGADYFSVATLAEAAILRECGVFLPILVLGFTPPSKAALLAEHELTQTVFSLEYAAALSKEASAAGVVIEIHIEVDSGMSRLGILADAPEAAEEIAEICSMPGFRAEGIFTHFAVSDEEGGGDYTLMQYDKFLALTKLLEERYDIGFEIKHCANSAAVINYPQTHLDMVRLGIALYGEYPNPDIRGGIRLEPVLELKTTITQVKALPAGTFVGYGRTHVLERDSRVAVIAVGYADGFSRAGSNRFEAVLHGRRAKGLGRVCMDMSMIDVTDIPEAKEGDTVTLIGRSGGEFISAGEYAQNVGTISYEVLSSLTKRVPRVYLE